MYNNSSMDIEKMFLCKDFGLMFQQGLKKGHLKNNFSWFLYRLKRLLKMID